MNLGIAVRVLESFDSSKVGEKPVVAPATIIDNFTLMVVSLPIAACPGPFDLIYYMKRIFVELVLYSPALIAVLPPNALPAAFATTRPPRCFCGTVLYSKLSSVASSGAIANRLGH